MTCEEVFLQAILAAPWDNLLRLVFADWLEEQGNARGEFIRVQCARARLAWDDPRWTELKRREKELLRQHGDAWRGRPPRGLGLRFERGLLKVYVNANHLDSDPVSQWLTAMQNWVGEWCLHCDEESFVRTLEQGLLAEATALDLSQSQISNAGLRHLAQLSRLRHLSFAGKHSGSVSDEDMEHLAVLNKLESLNLARNYNVTDTGLRSLAALKELRALDLDCTDITDTGLEVLAELKHLQWLDLSRIGVMNLPAHASRPTRVIGPGLRHLATLPHLRTLRLHGGRGCCCASHGITDETLKHVGRLRQLQELDIGCSFVTDAGLEHLAGMTQLRLLNLDRTNVTDAGKRKLANALPTCCIQHNRLRFPALNV